MERFDIREFLTENELTDTAKRLNEGRGFDSVEEFNEALRNVNDGKDAEKLLRTILNAQQDELLAKILIHVADANVYIALADAIQDLTKRSPDSGPFDRLKPM